MGPRQEQRDFRWGDLELKINADGLRYVKFSSERQQKHAPAKTQKMSEKELEGKPKMFEKPQKSRALSCHQLFGL